MRQLSTRQFNNLIAKQRIAVCSVVVVEVVVADVPPILVVVVDDDDDDAVADVVVDVVRVDITAIKTRLVH